MKKYLITALCLVLLLCAAGCSKKTDEDVAPDSPAVSDKASKEQNKNSKDNEIAESESINNSDTNSNSNEESKEQVVDDPSESSAADAPIIESTEELENIVDEFNNTDDPEKKEELRKKLEAFLEQAESASE